MQRVVVVRFVGFLLLVILCFIVLFRIFLVFFLVLVFILRVLLKWLMYFIGLVGLRFKFNFLVIKWQFFLIFFFEILDIDVILFSVFGMFFILQVVQSVVEIIFFIEWLWMSFFMIVFLQREVVIFLRCFGRWSWVVILLSLLRVNVRFFLVVLLMCILCCYMWSFLSLFLYVGYLVFVYIFVVLVYICRKVFVVDY